MREEAPEPPTPAWVRDHGLDVFCWCYRCCHNAVVPLAVLIAQFGPTLLFPHLHGHLRRQACGSIDIHARPSWRAEIAEARGKATAGLHFRG